MMHILINSIKILNLVPRITQIISFRHAQQDQSVSIIQQEHHIQMY